MATIYAAALNFAETYAALEPEMHAPPYNAPPLAPVLYIKPAGCRAREGAEIECPKEAESLRMGGTLAVIVGRRASRVAEAQALEYVGGLAIANDVSVPEASYFRPAVQQRCRDGFCPMSAPVAAAAFGGDVTNLGIRIFVNDVLCGVANTSTLRRGVAKLIADVTEFLTLEAGDVLLVGEPLESPLAKVGDRVRIEIDGLGSLTNTVVQERER